MVDVDILEIEEPTFDAGNRVMYQTVVTTEPNFTWEEPPKLSRFMYSLEQVYNFGRPALHFRHRSRLRQQRDLETLKSGRIDVLRSTYYGLLHHLPKNWRSYFEGISQVRPAAADEAGFSPARHLLQLLEQTVVETTALAADLELLRRQVVPEFPPETIFGVSLDSQGATTSRWSLGPLLRTAPRLNPQIQETLRLINEVEAASHIEGGKRQWHPHHW